MKRLRVVQSEAESCNGRTREHSIWGQFARVDGFGEDEAGEKRVHVVANRQRRQTERELWLEACRVND